MIPTKSLTLDVPHTKTLYVGLRAAHFLGCGTYTLLSRKLHLDHFHLQTSSQLFLLCHQRKAHEKISRWIFSTCPRPWEWYASIKIVHLIMQHPSLGSMTEGPTHKPEVLIPMPKPGQEPSIYICLISVKMVEIMHPKWEAYIVINSLICVVVCKNILYCLNVSKNYLWTKPASNKKRGRGILKNLIQAYPLVKRAVEIPALI